MAWKFTSWAVAQAMEKNPSFAKACVRDGHENAAHGLRWLDIGEMTVEEEREYIKENALSLERTTGVFPKGISMVGRVRILEVCILKLWRKWERSCCIRVRVALMMMCRIGWTYRGRRT